MQPQTYLHSVTDRDTAIVVSKDKWGNTLFAGELPIDADDKGRFYLVGKRKIYLPREFQVKLIMI